MVLQKNHFPWQRVADPYPSLFSNFGAGIWSPLPNFLKLHFRIWCGESIQNWWGWLFFQNATQLQLHGGKKPIVLFQEMKLQFELHVSIEPAAASLQRFNWSGPPPGTRIFLKEHLIHVPWENSSSGRGTWPVEPLQGSCSRLNADVQLKLQLHFLVQNNRGFTIVKLYLSRVLKKNSHGGENKVKWEVRMLKSFDGAHEHPDGAALHPWGDCTLVACRTRRI